MQMVVPNKDIPFAFHFILHFIQAKKGDFL